MKTKSNIILKFIIGTEVTTLKSGSLQPGWFYLVLEFEREGSVTTGLLLLICISFPNISLFSCYIYSHLTPSYTNMYCLLKRQPKKWG